MFCAGQTQVGEVVLNLHKVMSTHCTVCSAAHSLALCSYWMKPSAWPSLLSALPLFFMARPELSMHTGTRLPPLRVAPRLQTDNTHTDATVCAQNHIFLFISLNIQIHSRHRETDTGATHLKRADNTNFSIPLASRQHPVLWRNRKCVCLYEKLSEGGRITVRCFSFWSFASCKCCILLNSDWKKLLSF